MDITFFKRDNLLIYDFHLISYVQLVKVIAYLDYLILRSDTCHKLCLSRVNIILHHYGGQQRLSRKRVRR